MFTTERVGNVTVITCAGRLVEGTDATALDRAIDELLPFTPQIVLDLAAIEFVDSSGLGLLVRLLHRTRRAGGSLTLRGVPPRVDTVLRTTKLRALFDAGGSTAEFGTPDLLCVHPSNDVLAYLREMLGRAGYVLISAANLPDALTLLRASRPRAVVIAAQLRLTTGTSAGRAFNEIADGMPVVVLPDGFATDDAGRAGERLLADVRSTLPPSSAQQQL